MTILADIFLSDRAAATQMVVTIIIMNLVAVLGPYLAASLLMEMCRKGRRVLPLAGFWLYVVFFFVADIEECLITGYLTGPGVGDKEVGLNVAMVAWILFPIVLTIKWALLDARVGNPSRIEGLKKKLHPRGFAEMAPWMAAIVGYILGECFTDPDIAEIKINENLVYIRRVGAADFDDRQSLEDLRNNWKGLLDAAGLTAGERREAARLFNAKLGALPTKSGSNHA